MTLSNVEITERVVEAWNARDVDAILALTDPEAEYVNAPAAIEPGTRRGLTEIAEVFRKQWEGLTGDARQSIDRTYPDGDEVVTTGRVFVKLGGSDAEVANRLALRWTFREGLIIRLEVLGAGSSFDDGLRAGGISE